MNLAQAFREQLVDAKRRVTAAAGPVLVTMLDGMGYVIVPANLVDSYHRLLERADAQQGSPDGSKADG